MPSVVEAMDKLFLEYGMTQLRQGGTRAAAIPKFARQFLQAIGDRSVMRAAVAWRRCGSPSPAAKEKAIARLLALKLIAAEEIRLGKRNCLLVEATTEGRQLVGGTAPKRKGRGGPAHRFLSECIAAAEQRAGHQAQTEWVLPGTNHPCDVGVRDGNQWHVYEVVVDCETNLIAHLKACFLDSKVVATVTVVATQKSILERLEDLVSAELPLMPFRSRIKFEPAERYLIEETEE